MFSFRFVSRSQMMNHGHPVIKVCYVAFNHCRTVARADPHTHTHTHSLSSTGDSSSRPVKVFSQFVIQLNSRTVR